MLERLGTVVAWVTFLVAAGCAAFLAVGMTLFADNPGEMLQNSDFLVKVVFFPIGIYGIAMTVQYVVWGKMRFLPWKQ